MNDSVTLNSQSILTNNERMKNVKSTKKEVMKQIRSKLEKAKLDLIYTELEEANIQVEHNYSTVNEMKKDLKGKLSTLDYNRLDVISSKIERELDNAAISLDNGSTDAFTKLMSSDLMNTIAKTLGITLAGRTALILAPTIGTKALVGTGLAGYSLYKIIKNRKEIINLNENNELDNILMELETTKLEDKYVDTRFNLPMQEDIRNYLKNNNIAFDDTGYRSLRETIYTLTVEHKRGLCEMLNSKYGRGIEIESRVASAKKKLNVIASTATTVGAGATLGINMATAINSVDPAVLSGTLNGTLLAAWTKMQTDNPWISTLTGALTLIGTEVLEELPVVGKYVTKALAVENLATLATLGATGGLLVGTSMALVSSALQVKKNIDNKRLHDEFNKLDKEKYAKEDDQEFKLIRSKLYNPTYFVENIVIDVVMGYLKDEGINIGIVPKDVDELRVAISRLDEKDRKKANKIVSNIAINMEKDPTFVEKLKHAGKLSIGMFTAGLAVMSVYDIIKGGTVLPELSQALFPDSNIHTPVEIPEPLTEAFDSTISSEKAVIENNKNLYSEFHTDEFMVEKDGNSMIEYGANISAQNNNLYGMSAGETFMNVGFAENLIPDWLLNLFENGQPDVIPNVPAISEKLDTLSSEQMYNFYRYFNNLADDGTPMYRAVKEALSYAEPLKKASKYINDFEKTQKVHDIINNLTDKFGTTMIPFSVAVEILGIGQNRNSDKDFVINDTEIKQAGLGK